MIIENLEGCVVVIPFIIKIMFINNIKDCKVYASAVKAATFVNGSVGLTSQ